ncbi:MAG: phenylacetic acid degradation operon negative regulatory protein PaaX [Afipia sp.]|nr:phenylacetic acid degradation operon negative regulatory protein PaaX [Afipia sp.]
MKKTIPLSGILKRFKSEPSRTGSLIITFYGDAIVPRGGSIWLGTLLQFLEMVGIDGGVVRTSVSRLAADGWLDRDKVGRKSFYRLAKRGSERFEAAVEHVYNPRPATWEGKFRLLLIGSGADREVSRAGLSEAGFGSPIPGTWVAPLGVKIPPVPEGAICVEVSANHDMAQRLVLASWPLKRTAASYQDFLKTFAPLESWIQQAQEIAPEDAILARVLMIHHYRRVLLRDALLPEILLPANWPAGEARELCARIYRGLLPMSEAWLDEHGASATGKLPSPGAELLRRFR